MTAAIEPQHHSPEHPQQMQHEGRRALCVPCGGVDKGISVHDELPKICVWSALLSLICAFVFSSVFVFVSLRLRALSAS